MVTAGPSFLGRKEKIDLETLAVEFGIEIEPYMTTCEINKAILTSPNYEEEFVKEMIEGIVVDRKEKGKIKLRKKRRKGKGKS